MKSWLTSMMCAAAVLLVCASAVEAQQYRPLLETRAAGAPSWKASWDGGTLGVISDHLPMRSDFTFSGIPGAQVQADGSTIFEDGTFLLTGFTAQAPANISPIVPGITLLTQPIGASAFEMWCSGPAGEKTLLLRGRMLDAVIVGLEGKDTASLQSSTGRLDAGVVFDWTVARGGTGVGPMDGLFQGISPGLSVGSNGYLGAFGSDLNFRVLTSPEPGTIGIVALAGISLLRRCRRRSFQ